MLGRHWVPPILLIALLGYARVAAAQSPTAAPEPAVYVFASPGGTDLKAYVFTPKGQERGGKRAGIVIFHGGGWSGGEPSWGFARARHFAERGLVAVAAAFPINWSSARILRKFVEAYHREETEDVAKRLAALGAVADDDPEAQRLRTLQRELSAHGSKISKAFFPTINAALKEYDAPPVEVKEQILAFLEDLRTHGMPSSKERRYRHLQVPLVINEWLAIAAIHGAEGGLTDPHGASLIGPDVVAALAHRHTSRKHAMLGEGEVVQVAADEMKDRYLLLLQLGPDTALDWTVGEMGPLQYWITPEDLAGKRFENTVLTIEAY